MDKLKLIASLVGLLFFTSELVTAANINEFVLLASSFDTLSQHNRNCTVQINTVIAVVSCADGYIAIDPAS